MCAFEAPQLFEEIPPEWEFDARTDELSDFCDLRIEGWMPNGEGARRFLKRAHRLGL